MNPNLIGVIAESAVANEATQLGYEVYLPPFGSPRADMVFGVGNRAAARAVQERADAR